MCLRHLIVGLANGDISKASPAVALTDQVAQPAVEIPRPLEPPVRARIIRTVVGDLAQPLLTTRLSQVVLAGLRALRQLLDSGDAGQAGHIVQERQSGGAIGQLAKVEPEIEGDLQVTVEIIGFVSHGLPSIRRSAPKTFFGQQQAISRQGEQPRVIGAPLGLGAVTTAHP